MDDNIKKQLAADADGLLTYEYIANHVGACDDCMPELVDNLIRIDSDGQFCVSAARYLHAVDADAYGHAVTRLIAAAIDKDRDRRYIGALLSCIWGDDFEQHVDELNADDNFRRIYKRVYPRGI